MSEPDQIGMFNTIGRIPSANELLGENELVLGINVDAQIVEFDNERVLHPVNDELGAENEGHVGQDVLDCLDWPVTLGQIANKNNVKQPKQVETLANVGTGDL